MWYKHFWVGTGHSEEQWRVTALWAGEVKYLPLAWPSLGSRLWRCHVWRVTGAVTRCHVTLSCDPAPGLRWCPGKVTLMDWVMASEAETQTHSAEREYTAGTVRPVSHNTYLSIQYMAHKRILSPTFNGRVSSVCSVYKLTHPKKYVSSISSIVLWPQEPTLTRDADDGPRLSVSTPHLVSWPRLLSLNW